VTIGRNAPLSRDGTAQTSIYDLPDEHSEIFLRKGLDDPNHVESAHENRLYAQADFARPQGHRPGQADGCDVTFASAKRMVSVRSVGQIVFRYWRHLLLLSAESHCVMMLRTVRLAGGGASAIDEAWRILSEKTAATAEIPQRLLQTRSPLVLTVGYRKMVRQNLRRLSASAHETTSG
jgi:hypothetical protein